MANEKKRARRDIIVEASGGFIASLLFSAVSLLAKVTATFTFILLAFVVGFVSVYLYHRRFKKKILEDVGLTRLLADGSDAYRQINRCQYELREATAMVLRPLDGKDHPIVRVLEGWYSQVATEIARGGAESFEIDSDYYEACLARLKGLTSKVWAIADLSAPLERFWHSDPNPSETSVFERIFLLNQEDFFRDDRLHGYHRTFHRHSGAYRVRVGHVDGLTFDGYPEFDARLGRHLLLIEPDVVGGYVDRHNHKKLRFVRNKVVYDRLKREYDRLSLQTIEISPTLDYHALRKKWIQDQHIGVWDLQWSRVPVMHRSAEYFDKYDAHIRCWIPDYDQFIDACAERIKIAVVNQLRGRSSSIKLLEIGFGTGALTEPLLKWIDQWHDWLRIGQSLPVVQYLGLDAARDRMLPHLRRRLTDENQNRLFVRGSAWNEIPQIVTDSGPFDIIFGSLVLHDIVSQNSANDFEHFLVQSSTLLRPGGQLFFADVFTSSNPQVRARQRRDWSEWMVGMGLTLPQAKLFLEENEEMIETPHEGLIQATAQKHGFTAKLHPAGREPFFVLEMTKTN